MSLNSRFNRTQISVDAAGSSGGGAAAENLPTVSTQRVITSTGHIGPVRAEPSSSAAGAAITVCPATPTVKPNKPVVFEHEDWDDEKQGDGKEFGEVLANGTQAEKCSLLDVMFDDVHKFLSQAKTSVEAGMYGAAHEFTERAGDVLIMANEIVSSMKKTKPTYSLEDVKEKKEKEKDTKSKTEEIDSE